MGTPAAAVPTLARCLADGHEIAAVWTQPDRPAGRGNKLTPPPVKEFALAQGLTVHQPAKIKTAETRELFASHQADAAIVVAYGRILPLSYLQATRYGCVNVHFSLLPAFRGAAPVNWAIVRDARESGVTTMLMDEGLDTGDILRQRAAPIGPDETTPELLARLSDIGAELLSETLRQFHALNPQPQNHSQATFAPIMQREDGLLDWNLTAQAIHCRVRGFQPWPNAFTMFRGAKLVVWRAAIDETLTDAAPGTIIAAKGDNLRAACGGGAVLQLCEVQPEGKRRLPVRDFLNGARAQVGELLGSLT